MMLRGMALPEGGEGVQRGGRPGCPAGFESRARHANAGRRGLLNIIHVYIYVWLSLVEARALNVPPIIYRVEAPGLGIFLVRGLGGVRFPAAGSLSFERIANTVPDRSLPG